ncbi:MAG: T9SS type A sorting domain-containing protein [Bacteroidetes bacterium]|nr:T9SS type A sorting domain-containing protein [Bacteroidota bacterium]
MKKNYKNYLNSFCLALALLTMASTAKAQTVLYDNGPIFNSVGTGAGGANESVLYTTSFGMGTIGFGAQQYAFNRIADVFTVTDCQWNVDSIVFFCYQTGSSIASTITSINFRVWDSIPDDVASTLIFGDTVNNAMIRTEWSGVYRITETTTGNSARPIMRNVCTASGLTLSAGNYWMDWSYAGTLASGPWGQPIVLTNTAATGNGKQKVSGVWNNALDGGTGTTAQGFPFIIYGTRIQIVGTDTKTECNSYTWIDANTYTANNNTATHNIVGGASNGCDSLVTLDLTIINSTAGTDTKTECNSYTWIDGNTYTANNNTATHNIVGGASNGCDSLVTLDLTIINSATGTDTKTECNSYTWIDGNTYTASNNTATFNIANGAANGCDSLVTLDLTIINSASGTDTKTECNSYTWIDGNTYTVNNNTATFNIANGAANGCDSLVTLDLTIINSATGTDTRTECNSYTWIDGNTYTASNNTATFNIANGAANGCDSLVTLDLTIINSATGTDTRTECNSYTWIDGNTYTASNNTATFNIANGAANGCDSLVTLDLTINNVSDLTTSTIGITITANNSGATYQWLDCNNNYAIIASEISQSFTATINGDYAVELTENGCIDTSACVAITNVGVLENSIGDGLLVYPNPSNGIFSIDLGSVYENAQISITDILGKLIDTKNYSQSQILKLTLREQAGIYILSIKADDKMAVIRLIKK